MGLLIGLLIGVALIYVLAKGLLRLGRPSPAVGSAGRPSAPLATSRSAAEHRPAPPSAVPVEAWATQTESVEVAGESYRREAFLSIFRTSHAPEGIERRGPAVLTPDAANPFDRNAVAVWVEGQHVGYLPAEVAAYYHQSLARLSAPLSINSRTWARIERGHAQARVTIDLPEPAALRPGNPLPTASHVVLPAGGTIQVLGEESHQDVLQNYVGSDLRGSLAATLHIVEVVKARSTAEQIEVRLGGRRVGHLSPGQGSHLFPLIQRAESSGRVAVCRATVRGNSLKAEASLQVKKAHEVSETWLAQLDD